jgi:hypothetical protein
MLDRRQPMSILEEWSNAATVIVAVEAENKRLRAERDQLLAALKAIVESDNPILEDWVNARAAIAAVER